MIGPTNVSCHVVSWTRSMNTSYAELCHIVSDTRVKHTYWIQCFYFVCIFRIFLCRRLCQACSGMVVSVQHSYRPQVVPFMPQLCHAQAIMCQVEANPSITQKLNTPSSLHPSMPRCTPQYTQYTNKFRVGPSPFTTLGCVPIFTSVLFNVTKRRSNLPSSREQKNLNKEVK